MPASSALPVFVFDYGIRPDLYCGCCEASLYIAKVLVLASGRPFDWPNDLHTLKFGGFGEEDPVYLCAAGQLGCRHVMTLAP
jgi:hypothetical protein